MRVDGVFTRAGVFTYRNADGTERRELRPPDEVFRSDALESFALVPVTDDHPPTLVRKDNRKTYEKGYTLEDTRRDDDLVVGSLVVTDEALINKMDAGKVGLSCGYEVDLDETPGEHPTYGRYDAVQRNIRGNHLALVHNPRAGHETRVRMDALESRADYVEREGDKWCVYSESGKQLGEYATEAEARKRLGEIEAAKNTKTDSTQGARMDEIEKLNNLLNAAKAKLAEETARADKAEVTVAELKTRADQAEGSATEVPILRKRLDEARKDAEEVPRLQAEVKALTAELTDAKKRLDAEPERLRKAVKKRVHIEASAALILDKTARIDGLDDKALMLAVIEKTGRSTADCVDRGDEYIEAKFNGAVEGYHRYERALDEIQARERQDRDHEREDRIDPMLERKKMIARNRGQAKE